MSQALTTRPTHLRTIQPAIILIASLLCACSPGPDKVLQVAAQGLLCGDLSSQADRAVIGSVLHGGSLWQLDQGERIFDWNHTSGSFSSFRSCTFSGDGRLAVTTEEKNLVLWNTESGKTEQFWSAPDRILAIALNTNGSRALLGMRNGEASYFDTQRGISIFTFKHNAEIRSVDISSSGTRGLTTGDDNIVKIWDLDSGQLIQEKRMSNQIKTATLSASGKLAFSAAQREEVLIWDTQTGNTVFSFPNRYTNFSSASFSDDEIFLSAGTFQGEILRWKLPDGENAGKWQAQPRKEYGSSASKAIIALKDLGHSVVALSSDGMAQWFPITP